MKPKKKLPAQIWALKNHALVEDTYFDFENQIFTIYFDHKWTIICELYNPDDETYYWRIEKILDKDLSEVTSFVDEQLDHHFKHLERSRYSGRGFGEQMRVFLNNLASCGHTYGCRFPRHLKTFMESYPIVNFEKMRKKDLEHIKERVGSWPPLSHDLFYEEYKKEHPDYIPLT